MCWWAWSPDTSQVAEFESRPYLQHVLLGLCLEGCGGGGDADELLGHALEEFWQSLGSLGNLQAGSGEDER